MRLFNKNKSDESGRSILAIIQSDGVKSVVEKLTTVMPGIDVRVKQTDDTLSNGGTLVNGSADIVVVEADLEDERALLALEKLCTYVEISGSLLVIADDPSSTQIRDLFKMGVSDVLSKPLQQDDFQQAISSILGKPQTRRSRPAAGRVISVLKCGGGAGATTISTNIAHNLSSRKKNLSTSAPKVLVVDLDLQFGNVATSINASGKTSLIDLIKAENRMDPSLIAATARKVSEDMDVIAAPDSIIPLSAVSPEFVENLITQAKSIYDYIVLDLPMNWTGWTTKALTHSDAIIPVLHASVEHVQSAYKILEGLDNLQVNRQKTFFVINQIPKNLMMKDRIKKIEGVIKRPHFDIKEETKPHTLARDTGELLHNVSGGANYAKAINKCADQIIAQINSISTDGYTPAPSDEKSPKLSLR